MSGQRRNIDIKPWLNRVAFFIIILLLGYIGLRFWLLPRNTTSPVIQLFTTTLLESNDDRLRAMAARALGKTGDKSTIEPLANAYEVDPLVRREVILALKDLGLKSSDILQYTNETNISLPYMNEGL